MRLLLFFIVLPLSLFGQQADTTYIESEFADTDSARYQIVSVETTIYDDGTEVTRKKPSGWLDQQGIDLVLSKAIKNGFSLSEVRSTGTREIERLKTKLVDAHARYRKTVDFINEVAKESKPPKGTIENGNYTLTVDGVDYDMIILEGNIDYMGDSIGPKNIKWVNSTSFIFTISNVGGRFLMEESGEEWASPNALLSINK